MQAIRSNRISNCHDSLPYSTHQIQVGVEYQFGLPWALLVWKVVLGHGPGRTILVGWVGLGLGSQSTGPAQPAWTDPTRFVCYSTGPGWVRLGGWCAHGPFGLFANSTPNPQGIVRSICQLYTQPIRDCPIYLQKKL